MGSAEAVVAIILLVTAGVSITAFYHPDVQDRLIFRPERILAGKEYYRLITSAFLHADAWHLLINCYVFWAFGLPIASYLGTDQLALIYFGSILGGSLLALFLHRHHNYQALGASGGVCGVMFACLFLLPGGWIRAYFLVPLPGWLFLLLFLIGSYYGIRSQRDHIGHDAHLGGAIVGLLITTALHPQIVRASPVLYPVVLVLSLLMLAALLLNPLHLPWSSYTRPTGWSGRTPAQPADNERLDAILDKISKAGLQSLSRSEQEYLKRASRRKK